MSDSIYILAIVTVVLFSLVYVIVDKPFIKAFKIQPDFVTYESAKEALDRIAGWTTWLTGLQTAAIASIGFLFKPPAAGNLKIYCFFALIFFGSSIILATWLLSSLPSIQQRLINSKEPDQRNDIYMMKIFSFVPLRMGRFSGLIHAYFLFGIVFYALFIFEMFSE